MNELSPEIFEKMLDDHEAWLGSKGQKGTQLNLTDMKINHVKLHNRNLSKAICVGTDFSRNVFTECQMDDVNFINAKLDYNIYRNCEMRSSDFHNANMDHSDFFGSRADYSSFTDASMKECTSTYLQMHSAILDRVDWSGSFHTKLNLETCFADHANLSAKFLDSTIKNLSAETADISGAVLNTTHLTNNAFSEPIIQFGPLPLSNTKSDYLAYFPESNRVQFPALLKKDNVTMKEFEAAVDKLPKNRRDEKAIRNGLKGITEAMKVMKKTYQKEGGRI